MGLCVAGPLGLPPAPWIIIGTSHVQERTSPEEGSPLSG